MNPEDKADELRATWAGTLTAADVHDQARFEITTEDAAITVTSVS